MPLDHEILSVEVEDWKHYKSTYIPVLHRPATMYDSVERNLPWQVLDGFGVSPQMMTLVPHFHFRIIYFVWNHGSCSDWNEVAEGLHQRYVLSLLCFNILFAAVSLIRCNA